MFIPPDQNIDAMRELVEVMFTLIRDSENKKLNIIKHHLVILQKELDTLDMNGFSESEIEEIAANSLDDDIYG